MHLASSSYDAPILHDDLKRRFAGRNYLLPKKREGREASLQIEESGSVFVEVAALRRQRAGYEVPSRPAGDCRHSLMPIDESIGD